MSKLKSLLFIILELQFYKLLHVIFMFVYAGETGAAHLLLSVRHLPV